MVLLSSNHTYASPEAFPPKFRSCYFVYKDIISAVGRMDPIAPRLKPTADPTIIAEINPEGEILVGERLIDFCRQLGADSLNALALVLSHELGHHFKEHFWVKEYGSAYADVEWGRRIRSSFADIKELGVYESQADEFALFYSYIAGYDALHIAGDIYRDLYAFFDLQDDISGYPPLSQRIELARASAERVKKLIPIFEAGKMLIVLANSQSGDERTHLLDMAGKCFQKIVNENFVSREMYNNIGICYLMKAIGLQEYPKFKYPVVLDNESRLFDILRSLASDEDIPWVISLGQGGGGGWGDSGWGSDGWDEIEESPETYAGYAIDYFEQARKLDKNYEPAYINISVAHIILEEWDDAEYMAEKAQKLAQKADRHLMESYAIEVLAIVKASNENYDEARALFTEAKDLGCKLSEQNLFRLPKADMAVTTNNQNIADDAATDSTLDSTIDLSELITDGIFDDQNIWSSFTEKDLKEETVNGMALIDYYNTLEFNSDDIYDIDGSNQLLFKEINGATHYVIRCKGYSGCIYDNILLYQISDPSGSTTLQKVKVDDKVDLLEEAYGKSQYVISASTLQYLMYPTPQIAFEIDEDKKVKGWTIYDLIYSADFLRKLDAETKETDEWDWDWDDEETDDGDDGW